MVGCKLSVFCSICSPDRPERQPLSGRPAKSNCKNYRSNRSKRALSTLSSALSFSVQISWSSHERYVLMNSITAPYCMKFLTKVRGFGTLKKEILISAIFAMRKSTSTSSHILRAICSLTLAYFYSSVESLH